MIVYLVKGTYLFFNFKEILVNTLKIRLFRMHGSEKQTFHKLVLKSFQGGMYITPNDQLCLHQQIIIFNRFMVFIRFFRSFQAKNGAQKKEVHQNSVNLSEH